MFDDMSAPLTLPEALERIRELQAALSALLHAGKYWYPVGWKCSHGVNLEEFRCLNCDRLIDWKGMWLASQSDGAC